MSQEPKISVIMPTYNQADFIGDSIASVFAQDYENLELIIVDNHSDDGTEDVIKAIDDDRIHYIKFANQGVIAASRNHGNKHATGEFLAFLDSDDLWRKDKIQRQLPHLLENSEIVAVASNFTAIGHTEIAHMHLDHIPEDGFQDYTAAEVLQKSPIMTSSLIMRKKDFDALGGFDESTDYRYIEDWELWLRLSQQGGLRVLGQRLIDYRLFKKKDRDLRDVAERAIQVVERYAKKLNIPNTIYHVALGYNHMAMARTSLSYDKKQARHHFKLAYKYSHTFSRKCQAIFGLGLSLTPFNMHSHILALSYKLRSVFQ